jgi:hypothetical protein
MGDLRGAPNASNRPTAAASTKPSQQVLCSPQPAEHATNQRIQQRNEGEEQRSKVGELSAQASPFPWRNTPRRNRLAAILSSVTDPASRLSHRIRTTP